MGVGALMNSKINLDFCRRHVRFFIDMQAMVNLTLRHLFWHHNIVNTCTSIVYPEHCKKNEVILNIIDTSRHYPGLTITITKNTVAVGIE